MVNQINIFRLINGKVVTDTKVLKVVGINMQPMLDLLNKRNIPNIMVLEGFYNSLLLIRLHSFTKRWQDIMFIIDGQCFVWLERIYYLDKWFDDIAPLDERYTVIRVKVDFIEGK